MEECGVEFCLICGVDVSICEECEDGYRLNDPNTCIMTGDEGDDGLDDAAIIGNAGYYNIHLPVYYVEQECSYFHNCTLFVITHIFQFNESCRYGNCNDT